MHRRRGISAVLILCTLCLLTAPGTVHVQERGEKVEIEQKLDHLRSEISLLQEAIQKSRTEYSSQQNQLRTIELAIQDLSRSLRNIGSRLEQQNERLAELLLFEDRKSTRLNSSH